MKVRLAMPMPKGQSSRRRSNGMGAQIFSVDQRSRRKQRSLDGGAPFRHIIELFPETI
jgi:hypothetical protein